MISVVYRRFPHATHYAYNHSAIGHDLEQWDVVGSCRPIRPEGVPHDAEYHSGYIDKEERQHFLFVRTAPLSGPPCPQCPIRTCGAIGVRS